MALLRKRRSDAPFSEEQETWIILEYGSLRNILQVRRKFRIHFKLFPQNVPNVNAFERLVQRNGSFNHYDTDFCIVIFILKQIVICKDKGKRDNLAYPCRLKVLKIGSLMIIWNVINAFLMIIWNVTKAFLIH